MLKKTGIHLLLTPLIIILLIHSILPKPPLKQLETVKSIKREKTLGIYFYTWFGNQDGSPGSRHWDNTPDTPIIGRYSSHNETVIDWQLDMIQKLDIDFLFLSWWGEDSFEDKAIKKLLAVNNKRENPINFSILVEPYEGDSLAVAQARDAMGEPVFNYEYAHEYIWSTFIEPYPEYYQRYHGKPLLTYFNPAQPPIDPKYETHILGDCDPSETWEDWVWMLCDYGSTSDNSSIHPPWFSDEDQRARNGYCSVLPRFGEIKPTNLLDPKFLLQYTFTPLIIIAMIAFFTGRLLTGSPLSVLGTGQTTIAITVGTQALTLFLEAITLGQRYTSKTYLGFVVGLISLALVLNPQQV